MQNNRKVGEAQETRTVLELEKLGYRILKKNFRCRIGEIDIIALHQGYLVFVEVKYRTSAKFGRPIEAITPHKLMKIRQTATAYLKFKRLLDANVRFDAIEILDDEIRHIQNIM